MAASVAFHPDVYWKSSAFLRFRWTCASLTLAQGYSVLGDGVHQEVNILSGRVTIYSSLYRHYFAKRLDHIIRAEAARRAAIKVEQQLTTASARASSGTRGSWSRRIFRSKSDLGTVPEDSSSNDVRTTTKENAIRLRPDMIRRMDAPPKLINPSGRITESSAVQMKHISLKPNATSPDMQAEERAPSPRQLEFPDEISYTPEQLNLGADVDVKNVHIRRDSSLVDRERSTS